MWPSERYTQRRGRSVVPETLVRTRACTRLRCRSRDSFLTRADATVRLLLPLRLRAGLPGLLLQELAGDANAFLLIWIGRPQRANVRSHLAALAFVGAADDQVRLLVHGDLNALGNLELDGVGLAKRKGDRFAFELRAIADTHDVEFFLETLRDAMNGVGNERASQAMQRAVLFGGALGAQHAVFLLEGDAEGHTHGELALGALHFDLAVFQRDFHALRHGNWFVADTRHCYQTSHK